VAPTTDPADAVAGASSTDPEIGLRAVASLRALLEAVEKLQVANAREHGWSWQRIAAVLGISRQAVHQKHGQVKRGRPRKPT
jgi:hypothetical protein